MIFLQNMALPTLYSFLVPLFFCLFFRREERGERDGRERGMRVGDEREG